MVPWTVNTVTPKCTEPTVIRAHLKVHTAHLLLSEIWMISVSLLSLFPVRAPQISAPLLLLLKSAEQYRIAVKKKRQNVCVSPGDHALSPCRAWPQKTSARAFPRVCPSKSSCSISLRRRQIHTHTYKSYSRWCGCAESAERARERVAGLLPPATAPPASLRSSVHFFTPAALAPRGPQLYWSPRRDSARRFTIFRTLFAYFWTVL